RGARARRGGGLPRRAQGGRGRRRGRGCACAGCGGRPRCERRRLGRARRARPGSREPGGARVNEPRRINPLPLGGDELGLPYSRGLMARSLMAAGVAGHRAYALASRVHDELRERGQGRIELERLEALAVEVLGEEEGRESIQRLRRYQELRELDLPIMVFIGGATGTGKSTVAAELAYRFGITRVTSTDFVRQTMRAFFSSDFMPSIHQSSFEAGDAYPDADDPLEFGFLQQARN